MPPPAAAQRGAEGRGAADKGKAVGNRPVRHGLRDQIERDEVRVPFQTLRSGGSRANKRSRTARWGSDGLGGRGRVHLKKKSQKRKKSKIFSDIYPNIDNYPLCV